MEAAAQGVEGGGGGRAGAAIEFAGSGFSAVYPEFDCFVFVYGVRFADVPQENTHVWLTIISAMAKSDFRPATWRRP